MANVSNGPSHWQKQKNRVERTRDWKTETKNGIREDDRIRKTRNVFESKNCMYEKTFEESNRNLDTHNVFPPFVLIFRKV